MGEEGEWRDVGARSSSRTPAPLVPPAAGGTAGAGYAGRGPRARGRGRGAAQSGRHGSLGPNPGRGGAAVNHHSHSHPHSHSPSDSQAHAQGAANGPSGHGASEPTANSANGTGPQSRGGRHSGASHGAPGAGRGAPGPGWQAQGQRGSWTGGGARGGGAPGTPGARHPTAPARRGGHHPGRGSWGAGAPGVPHPGAPGAPGVDREQQAGGRSVSGAGTGASAGAGVAPVDPGPKPRAPVFITDLSQLAQHYPSLLSDSSDDDDYEDAEGEEGGGEGGDGGGVPGEGRAPKQRQRASASELESGIFRAYQGQGAESEGGGGVDPSFGGGVEKIREHLNALQSGGATCLICLERIKASDPVWSCRRACHSVLHLLCIQSWARQAGPPSGQPGPLPGQPGAPSSQPGGSSRPPWQCPMCRTDYEGEGIPREYLCFCGKVLDPPFDPWLTPHSCGEPCGRALGAQCQHKCTLLCHPGPCPPCPQLVDSSCFCGQQSDLRRCAGRRFSCGAVCGRLLPCGAHRCEAGCHEGACPPCAHESSFRCACGRVAQWRRCAERAFSCGDVCGKPLPCGRHDCELVCHPGACPGCPLSGRRLCPCGKKGYEGLPCDQPAAPCGATCEKPLACGRHPCSDRCHLGDCSSVCRVVILKHCACGSTKKEVPCHQEVHCERRCQRGRSCGRHLCKRRCCTGDCPPCSEVCNKKLRCGNHKCPAPCHSGPCAPCPVTVRIACCCGSTSFSVPCGAEKQQRPPKCALPCGTPPACRHGGLQKPHRCHYGPCPPCDCVCNEALPCGHPCPVVCHGPQPPPHPDYTLRPKKKAKKGTPEAPVAEAACPPCRVPMVRRCRGRHKGQELTLPCSQDPVFSCSLPCGNPLDCGNHTCKRVCHVVTNPRLPDGSPAPVPQDEYVPEAGSGQGETREGALEGEEGARGQETRNGQERGEEHWEGQEEEEGEYLEEDEEEEEEGEWEEEWEDACEVCELPCAKPRDPPCAHPCGETCHPGPCQPCRELVKRACHCGAMSHVFECAQWGAASEPQRLSMVACGGPCHRKLPHCTHLCPQICHPGPCPAPRACRKKVAVRCACMRLKKEWLCCDVQAAERKAAAGAKAGPSTAAASSAGKRVSVAGVGLIPCDAECRRLEAERAQKAAEEQERRKQEEAAAEAARAAELAKGGLRRRRRGQRGSLEDDTRQSFLAVPESVVRAAKIVFVVALVVTVLAALGVWLARLSDYMNQRDARRPRAKFRY